MGTITTHIIPKPEAKPIYAVTTLRYDGGDEMQVAGRDRCRTVGFYHDLPTAKKTVEENIGDLWEAGWYPYAVVEAVEPGLYPS